MHFNVRNVSMFLISRLMKVWSKWENPPIFTNLNLHYCAFWSFLLLWMLLMILREYRSLWVDFESNIFDQFSLSSITPDNSLISYCSLELTGILLRRSHVGSIIKGLSMLNRKNNLSKYYCWNEIRNLGWASLSYKVFFEIITYWNTPESFTYLSSSSSGSIIMFFMVILNSFICISKASAIFYLKWPRV